MNFKEKQNNVPIDKALIIAEQRERLKDRFKNRHIPAFNPDCIITAANDVYEDEKK